MMIKFFANVSSLSPPSGFITSAAPSPAYLSMNNFSWWERVLFLLIILFTFSAGVFFTLTTSVFYFISAVSPIFAIPLISLSVT